MKNKVLFALWGVLWILCAGLGFIAESSWLLTLMAVACFVPPLMLLRSGKRRDLELIRNLSAASLVLTMVLIIANFLSFAASDALGVILHCLLVIISSPMVCSGYWVLSLFLWAVLLFASVGALKKK